MSLSTNRRKTNFHLHNEHLVNGVRKPDWASVFLLKWQHMFSYINFHIYIYNYILKLQSLTENGNLENVNDELPFVCCKQNRKLEVWFLGWRTRYGNRRVLFYHMCPSMPDVLFKLSCRGRHVRPLWCPRCTIPAVLFSCPVMAVLSSFSYPVCTIPTSSSATARQIYGST